MLPPPSPKTANSICRHKIREVWFASIKQYSLPTLTLSTGLVDGVPGFRARLCASAWGGCGCASTSAALLHPRCCPAHILWHLPSWPLTKLFSQCFSASFSELNGQPRITMHLGGASRWKIEAATDKGQKETDIIQRTKEKFGRKQQQQQIICPQNDKKRCHIRESEKMP